MNESEKYEKKSKNSIFVIGFACIIVAFVIILGILLFRSETFAKKYSGTKQTACGPTLIYADSTKVIFYDTPGLIVYNYSEKKIVNTIDFSEERINSIQGSEAYSILSSYNGDEVYFTKVGQKSMVYNLSNKEMKEQEEIDENNSKIYDCLEELDISTYPNLISNVIQENQEHFYLALSGDSEDYSGLVLNIVSKTGSEQQFKIFR